MTNTLTVAESLKTLKGVPRELWLVYVMKCLESYAYFSMSLSLVIFLSDEFGFDDVAAGSAYGLWGFLTSVYGFGTGVLIDYLGVKLSLVLGASISAIGRLVLVFARSSSMVYLSLYLFLPLGMSLGIPVLTIGIKRYTNYENRTYAYAFFYSVMNIAALVSGPAVDGCRYLIGDNGLVIFGTSYSAFRLVFFSGALATIAMIFIALFGFREVQLNEMGEINEFTPARKNTFHQIKKTLRDKNFWRLMLFSLLIMAVRLLFRHLDATFPKYMIRELGEHVPYGTLYSINPLMIIFLVPVVGVRMAKIHPYKAIVDGSYIAAVSPFFFLFGASYLTAVLMIVTLSIGEAVYSPRVYEYTMVLAPTGAEGLYSALASLPLFAAKFFAGTLSGWLLERYCPAEGPRNSRMMWGVIGIISLTSPILMTLLTGVLVPGGTHVSFKGSDDDHIALVQINQNNNSNNNSTEYDTLILDKESKDDVEVLIANNKNENLDLPLCH